MVDQRALSDLTIRLQELFIVLKFFLHLNNKNLYFVEKMYFYVKSYFHRGIFCLCLPTAACSFIILKKV